MNPLTNVRNVQKLNEKELELGLIGKKSWHDQYKDSAWVFIGGLPYDLTEGDVICVFSQYGEVVNINMVRDKQTGKTKGYAFLCYEDQRSTILAVDNINGFKVLGRTLRVDHVEGYRRPKEHGDEDEITMKIRQEGCAPTIDSSEEEEGEEDVVIPKKKVKKEKEKKSKKKKEKKKKKKEVKSESSSDSEEDKSVRSHDIDPPIKIKKEKEDSGYEKHLQGKEFSKDRSRSYSSEQRDKYRDSEKRDKGREIGYQSSNNRTDRIKTDREHSYLDSASEKNERIRGSDRQWGQGKEKQENRGDRRRGDDYLDKPRNDYRDRESDRSDYRDRDKIKNEYRGREKERNEYRDRDREMDRNDYRDRERDRDNYRDRQRDSNRYEDNYRRKDR